MPWNGILGALSVERIFNKELQVLARVEEGH
jgi:hypothetical protein